MQQVWAWSPRLGWVGHPNKKIFFLFGLRMARRVFRRRITLSRKRRNLIGSSFMFIPWAFLSWEIVWVLCARKTEQRKTGCVWIDPRGSARGADTDVSLLQRKGFLGLDKMFFAAQEYRVDSTALDSLYKPPEVLLSQKKSGFLWTEKVFGLWGNWPRLNWSPGPLDCIEGMWGQPSRNPPR